MSISKSQRLTRVALFAALTAAGAYIAVPLPFTPVPLTLQLLFPLLGGLVLGPRDGALSQIVYIGMGAVGIPVFAAGTGGFGVLLGPTGGYLWGFVAAAAVTGALESWLAGRGLPAGRRGTLAVIAGLAVVYALGVGQLAVVADLDIYRAVALGLIPYIGLDSVKAVVAIVVWQAVRRAVPGMRHALSQSRKSI